MPELQQRFLEGDLIAEHYRVVGVAGAGGMGVVYRAQDINLQRTVAIKVLPSTLHPSPRDEERFLREARTASSLDHQNIGVIHEVGSTSDGVHFIVMAFYEGDSLADRIDRGPMAPGPAVDIALQMAEGLDEAHNHGIIHRDIKPSNVMISRSGVAKIVDFGLAQIVSAATATQTGTIGTISYMSPEQVLGQQLDQSTDLWALGVTLIEMLSGKNPFERATVPAILFAILNDPPQGMEAVPEAVQPIVYRCLSKSAAERYASARELIVDLRAARAELPTDEAPARALTTPMRESAATRRAREYASRSALGLRQQPERTLLSKLLIGLAIAAPLAAVILYAFLSHKAVVTSGAAEPHVAVLPFEDIGSTPENEVLSSGLVDSIAGRLSDLKVGDKSLWVVPNSEVRRLKITDPTQALQQLHANLVVKGSIERDGQHIQLHVNLIDTKDLRQVGSVEVQDEAGDLATLENESVAKLAQLMHLPVTAEMLRTTDGAITPAAYEDYLTALGYMQRYDKAGNLDLAISALKKSIATDPRFAVGYASLGEAYRLKYQTGHDGQGLVEAEANSRKAIELNDHLPQPYVTLGRVHDSSGQHELSLQEFQHALQLNPRDPSAIAGLAHAYESADRLPDAEATYRRAVALSSEDWDGYNNLAMYLQRQRKYGEAIETYKHALQLAPDNAQVLFNLGAAYIDSGDPAALKPAEAALLRSIAINPSYAAHANMAALYISQRRFAESAAASRKALQLNPRDYLVWDNLRIAVIWQGDRAAAKSAEAAEAPLLLAYLKTNPADSTAEITYADLQAGLGMKQVALSHLRTALALSPSDPSVLEAAASTYQNLGDHQQAVTFLKEALARGLPPQAAKDDPEAQPLLAEAGIKTAN